jgi:hypothetical protein
MGAHVALEGHLTMTGRAGSRRAGRAFTEIRRRMLVGCGDWQPSGLSFQSFHVAAVTLRISFPLGREINDSLCHHKRSAADDADASFYRLALSGRTGSHASTVDAAAW